MPERKASAIWEGDLKRGKGKMRLGSRAFEGTYSIASRFGQGEGTNPEELIGAAHAGCFSMALAGNLAEKGFTPDFIWTEARVSLEKSGDGFKINEINLSTEARVQDIGEPEFRQYAEEAKSNCPVSRALKGTKIKLEAVLTK